MANSFKLCHKRNMVVELVEDIEMDEHLSETSYLKSWDLCMCLQIRYIT